MPGKFPRTLSEREVRAGSGGEMAGPELRATSEGERCVWGANRLEWSRAVRTAAVPGSDDEFRLPVTVFPQAGKFPHTPLGA